MPNLKLPNLDDVVAIDIHTHAEEPCGMHGDDGYDDFQAKMADYFKSPNKHPPTVQAARSRCSTPARPASAAACPAAWGCG